MTLVSAPAGYGKTTLLTAWSKRPSSEGVAWLTLERSDNDPVRLWASIGDAVEQARSGAGRRSAQMIRARGVDPSDALQELLGDLAQAAPLAIVLDDLHVVEDDECLELLEYALEHLPPGVRVIAGSRVDPRLPLARFRGRGVLGELRAADLAFTQDEAWELLVGTEGLDLGDEEVALLAERTEGWPVALYLAALWLRDEDDPRGRAREFAGSQRYVAEYLTDEVLSRLDGATREFLVRTSVFDRFCAPLCDEVLRFDNSRAVLAEMSKSNLLLVPLDENGDWFRLHHLLDELLTLELDRTEPAVVPDLHRRAAAWFRARDLPEDAVEHALAAGDCDLAAAILGDVWSELLRRSEGATLARLVERLPAEVALAHPELVAASALGTVGTRAPAYDRARWLSIAERARVEAPESWTARAEMVVALTRALAIDGDIGGAAGQARRAIELEQEHDVDEHDVLAFATLAWALYLRGEKAEASTAASLAVASINAPQRPHGVVRALGTLALVAADEGRMDEAAATAERALAHAAKRHFTSAASVTSAHLARSRTLAARGLLREAEAAAERGERLARAPDPSVSHAHALLVLADVRARHGRTSEAEEALRAATGEIKTFADPGQLPLLAARVKRSLRAARAVIAVRTEPLSPAELVVLGLLATDLSQRGIGRKLFLSVNTIKTHTRSIYRKLAVTSRENAVTRGHALGLIGSDDSPG